MENTKNEPESHPERTKADTTFGYALPEDFDFAGGVIEIYPLGKFSSSIVDLENGQIPESDSEKRKMAEKNHNIGVYSPEAKIGDMVLVTATHTANNGERKYGSRLWQKTDKAWQPLDISFPIIMDFSSEPNTVKYSKENP